MRRLTARREAGEQAHRPWSPTARSGRRRRPRPSLSARARAERRAGCSRSRRPTRRGSFAGARCTRRLRGRPRSRSRAGCRRRTSSPAGDETFDSHSGGTPVTKPRFHARTPPVTIAPTASVITSAGTMNRWQIQPVRPPTRNEPSPRNRNTCQTSQRSPVPPRSSTVTVAPTRIQPAIETSRPPIRTHSVCPSAEMPSSEASTSIALMLNAAVKLSSVAAPKRKIATIATTCTIG